MIIKPLPLLFLLSSVYTFPVQAANWVKLGENTSAKLFIDKQSVIQKEQHKRAWVKIEYKTLQKHPDIADQQYDLSKALWYFDCAAQKAATSQVFQYLHNELIHSAGIDVKNAEFIEPVPETELDQAMRYACASQSDAKLSKSDNPENKDKQMTSAPKTPEASKVTASDAEEKKAEQPKPTSNATQAKNVTPAEDKKNNQAKNNKSVESSENKQPISADKKTNAKPLVSKHEKNENNEATEKALDNKTEKAKNSSSKDKKKDKKANHKKDKETLEWGYEQENGPERWGKLNPDYTTCEIGKNQSPIAIDSSLKAQLPPIKMLYRYAAKEIVNDGKHIKLLFTDENVAAIDNNTFHMKSLVIHTPAEHQIEDQSYPMELQFHGADSKGNVMVMSLLFKEGKANATIQKIIEAIPEKLNENQAIDKKILPNTLFTNNRQYYRYTGSLSTPPCSEGVSRIVMKTQLTASKEQLDTLRLKVPHPNNRPVQPLNGRLVVE